MNEGPVVFVGSKSLGLNCLRRVWELDPNSLAGIVTFDDTSDTRTVFDQFLSFAEKTGVPLLVAKNRLEAENAICAFHPNICLVVGWYWLITRKTLDRVPRGLLGIHNSLLPRYRGCAPLVWAMINGEPEVGLSLFSFTDGMDDGHIWGQTSVTVGKNDYIADVLEQLESKALALLSDVWLSILDGKVQPVAQDHSQATFCGLRTPDDGQIDWTRPAAEVYNFIRAQSAPYPGAFTSVSGTQKLTIWRARPVDVYFSGTPGQVAEIRQDGVYVICGDNRPLLLEEVSPAGGGKMRAREVLKSLKTRLSPAISELEELNRLKNQLADAYNTIKRHIAIS
jgi:methionyl-tRNA formyltransferase